MGKDYKIDKIVLNNKNGWKAFKELRNDKGVIDTLKNAGNDIGETVATYKGITRGHAIVKVDMDTFNSLLAEGKIKLNEKGEEYFNR